MPGSVTDMAHDRIPSTPAVRALRQAGVEFESFHYDYEENGGTRQFSDLFGVAEGTVVKTLIIEDDHGIPMCVLMPGDREVSLKALARHRGARACRLCDPATAQRHSGYRVGGTSPLGLKKSMDVLVERSILDLPRVHLNGGSRGFIIGLTPSALASVLPLIPVEVGPPG